MPPARETARAPSLHCGFEMLRRGGGGLYSVAVTDVFVAWVYDGGEARRDGS